MALLRTLFLCPFLCATVLSAQSTDLPAILTDPAVRAAHFLPDFSYAGYHFGEAAYPTAFDHRLNVTDFGAVADDGMDDGEAFINALDRADELDGFVLIEIPAGRFNVNQIIYINRSKTVIRGVGAGAGGTELHFDRPLRFVADPPENEELREYISRYDKTQRQASIGLSTPFSQYSWTGGYFWVAKKGKQQKSYNLPEFNRPIRPLAKGLAGRQGEHTIEVDDASTIAAGKAYQFAWFNKGGKDGSLLDHLYAGQTVKIGEYHWDYPDRPLVPQMVLVTRVDGNTIHIKDPLLHDVRPEWSCAFLEWEHLEEVGLENLAFVFPPSPDYPHHVEQGNNAIYLTSLMNGWVRNLRIENADSGILTDDISNVTIENVRTHGDKLAHYSVAMGEVHNVLVRGLRVENNVRHTISFNTRSSKCVYTDCVVEQHPILDQHRGINEQNLFDRITAYVDAPVHETGEYKIFKSGGAGSWAPGHGAYSTMYNIRLIFANVPADPARPVLLSGMGDGVLVRLIGFHANHPLAIKYGPQPYIEMTDREPAVRSLYDYQLRQRLGRAKR